MKQIVFLDIDGTLLDENYRSNDDGLKKYLKHKANEGTIFSFNSNRSLEDLLSVAKEFGVEGMLIGENGVFSYDTVLQKTTLLLKAKQLQTLTLAKQQLEAILKDVLHEISDVVIWKNTDTVKELKNVKTLSYKEGTLLALNNKYRKYTISTHVMQVIGGTMQPLDQGTLNQITQMIRHRAYDHEHIEVTYSPAFSNILMYSRDTSKKHAIESILRAQNIEKHNVFAVGDEINDYYMIQGEGQFLTTANAPKEVKRLADVVSEKPFTAGVHDVLVQTIGT